MLSEKLNAEEVRIEDAEAVVGSEQRASRSEIPGSYTLAHLD